MCTTTGEPVSLVPEKIPCQPSGSWGDDQLKSHRASSGDMFTQP